MWRIRLDDHYLCLALLSGRCPSWTSFVRPKTAFGDRRRGHLERSSRIFPDIGIRYNYVSYKSDSDVQRAIKAGGDSRFNDVKGKPLQFTMFWLAQGNLIPLVHGDTKMSIATWISVVGLPVYLCNVLPANAHPPLGVRDYAAFCVYAVSLFFEIIADQQKSAWRRSKDAKQHKEKFITSGLWSISRHPKLRCSPP